MKRHTGPRDPRAEKRRDFRRGRGAVRANRESAAVRRLHRRSYRQAVRVLLAQGLEETIPPFRGTQGWDTW